jgi:hypothetical protein
MFDSPDSDDDGARIFRASLPGWQSTLRRPRNGGAALFAPGRGRLELSVMMSAFALVVPLCALPALGCALLARRAGSGRWLAASVAAAWCGLLGLAFRVVAGMGSVP